MSGDEAFLEFRLGEPEPNPWASDTNSGIDDADPWGAHEHDLGFSHDISSPQVPPASRIRHSRNSSLEEDDLSQYPGVGPSYTYNRSKANPFNSSLEPASKDAPTLSFYHSLDLDDEGDLHSVGYHSHASTSTLVPRKADQERDGSTEAENNVESRADSEKFSTPEAGVRTDGTGIIPQTTRESIQNDVPAPSTPTKQLTTGSSNYVFTNSATNSATNSGSTNSATNSATNSGSANSASTNSVPSNSGSTNSGSTNSATNSVTNSATNSVPANSGSANSESTNSATNSATKSVPTDPVSSPRSVHFSDSEIAPPAYSEHKGHKRGNSHIEYRQDLEGNVEKLHISNDNGLPVEDEHDLSDDNWEPMPTVGSYEVYDDKNNLLVEIEQEADSSAGNAAASGYTRVASNDDTASVTSLDDKTDFLFDQHKPTDEVDSEFQMAATKSMLTDEQRIAYAGLFRLTLAEIANKVRKHGPKSRIEVESLQKWGSKIILRLYSHLGLDNDEQLMIESLATHNLQAEDLTPCLKRHQRVDKDGKIEVYEPTVKVVKPEADADASGADASGDNKTGEPKTDEPKTELVFDDDVDADELHEDLPRYSQMSQGMEVDVKWTIMCDMFLILLGEGSYDSRSRSALMIIADKLGISANEVAQFERKVTDVLQIDDTADQDWTEEDIIEMRRRKALRKKYAYVGLATVGGGLVIGLSGGLLAPVVGAGLAGALGTIGITGTAGFLAGVGGTALITTASTAVGATVGSRAMLRRAGHVKTFEFRPIYNNNRVNLIITISGWMTGKDDDVRLPFSTIDPIMGDVLSVHWEPEMMRSLGQTINILATEALAFGVQQILAATIFTVLLASLQAPMWLAKLSYLVDNPWSVSLDRAWAAGYILADTLINRKLGKRPATLVGYGLGARVIYSCITELGRKQQFGLVQDVFLFGTPVFYNKKNFRQARSVVSGRYVNGYSRNDWILAFLFPAAKRYGMVMGLDSIPEKETEDLQIENMDVSDTVDGHMQYRAKMPSLLAQCGWAVLSEEFEEIEDPDPDQLREKQRKLLNELDTVEKPKKSGFFSSWNFDWMQRAKSKTAQAGDDPVGAGDVPRHSSQGETLFDVDALRSEMESMKPRMVFEQEPMPLPEHNNDDLPPEFEEFEEDEPLKPGSAVYYDSPAASKLGQPGQPSPSPTKKTTRESKPDNQPQLQFDDLE